jgi:hypothetical protein
MRAATIKGHLVELRELTDDAQALHAVYGDPAVTSSLSFTPRTLGQCAAIITAAQADVTADPRQVYMLAVADPAGTLVGAARLGLGEWRSAQFGLALRPDHWGRGEGTEAVRLLQQLAFTELGMHPAAANTVARKRAVLSNVLDYGVGRGLDANPLPAAAKVWTPPKTTEGTVDPRVVINRRQAEGLLTAVSYQGRIGPKLVAFFACIYYAGTRPSETVELRVDLNLDLPEDDDWGTLYLHGNAPTVGAGWSRSGRRRDPRQLKPNWTRSSKPRTCAETRRTHSSKRPSAMARSR